MPAILIGAAVVSIGSSLWANKKRKDAAEDAQAAMAAEEEARQEQINQALSDLDALESGEINIPISKPEVAPKTEVEKGKIGDNYFDALDTAKSDAAINQQIKQSEKALSAQLDIQDPRIKAAVAAKAVDKFNDEQAEIQAQGKEDIMTAQMAVGQAQTANEMDFVRRQQQADENYNQRLQAAENMYSQQVNQYMQNEYNRLQNIIGDQTEEQYGLQYGQSTVVGQAQAQNAADFSGAVNDTIGMALPYSGATGFEDGGRLPNTAEEGTKVKSRARNEAMLRWMASLTPRGIETLAAAAPRSKKVQKKEEENTNNTTDSTNEVMAENYTAPTTSGMGAKSFEDSRIDDLVLQARMGGKFSLEEGGVAAMTRGEFNHGDVNKPETGNDQVLIDQEDLKAGLDSGAINTYQDIEDNNMVQAITTGGELIFNDKDSGNIEKLTMDTDPMDMMGYARKGKKLKKKKGKKKSKAQIRKAEAALAAYMRNLLSQDQFQA